MTEPAEPGQRLLARVVDTLVVGLPVVLVARSALPRVTADAVAAVAIAGLLLLYETVQLALWGRTLGKRVAGIEVALAEAVGGPLGLPRAFLRSAVYALPLAARPVPVLGVVAGIFWVANAGALFEGTRRQALHDRLCGTVVVRHARVAGTD